jgi:hypothetical protein
MDVVFINQPAHRAKLETNPDVRLEETVLNSLIYLGFNNRKAPFDDAKVRQALSHAINKDQIVETALGGLGIAAYAPLPPTLPGFDPALKANELGYDVEKAKSLLADAGFEAGADGMWNRDGQPLKAVLLTSTRPPNDATPLSSVPASRSIPVIHSREGRRRAMRAVRPAALALRSNDHASVSSWPDRIGSTNRVPQPPDTPPAQGANSTRETPQTTWKPRKRSWPTFWWPSIFG